MERRVLGLAPLLVALSIAACERGAEDAQERELRLTAEAREAYDPATYDTVQWESREAAVRRGEDVYRWACADCHGETGRGDGGYVHEGDTLRPPSFRRPDFPLGGDLDALRRQVYAGSAVGMPHWGLRRMHPRDIDAVAIYIQDELIRQ
jgi:mono/diheme cytochrome c family protein